MRVMMIVKANEETEAGVMPSEESLSTMGKYNEELMKAGVLLDLGGLKPTSKGARVKFSEGKPTVVDGPFTESKELVGGYWIVQVKSLEEAIEWARRAPAPHGPHKDAEIEIRPFYELEDFEQALVELGPGEHSEAIERMRERGKILSEGNK